MDVPPDLAAVFFDGGRMRTRVASLRRKRRRLSETGRPTIGPSSSVGFPTLCRLPTSFMPWNTFRRRPRRSTLIHRPVGINTWSGPRLAGKATWRGSPPIFAFWQSSVGVLPEGEKVPETDPRKIIHNTLTYLTNNTSRMNYPRYRLEGLPVTSSLAESLVKQISKRVKGTEKFWNDGPSGEAILQLRAAVLSDDDRLQHRINNRPIPPFHQGAGRRCSPTAAKDQRTSSSAPFAAWS